MEAFLDIRDEILDKLSLTQALSLLAPEPRLVIELSFGLIEPTNWPWKVVQWPPTDVEIGVFVGTKFRDRPVSEATVRYIRKKALLQMRAVLSG
jgi:hypothetical protein